MLYTVWSDFCFGIFGFQTDLRGHHMGKTSTTVKRRYNEKTYTRWFADLRNEDFEEIENLRGDFSRAKFLKMLVACYIQHNENKPS